MKLLLHCSNFPPHPRVHRLVTAGLAALRPLLRIEEARVRLEHRPEASPAYRAVVHLVVPGPDLRTEAIDHTAENAFSKVLARLHAQATARAARRRPSAHPQRHRPGLSVAHR